MLYIDKEVIIAYKRNIKRLLFSINNDDLFITIDRLNSSLIEERDIIDIYNKLIFRDKSYNIYLKR